MKTSAVDILPAKVRRSLVKFGGDIGRARRRRRLTMAMMAERAGIARSTYARVEKGDPSVSLGVYAMVLFALGFGDPLARLVDSKEDDVGQLLDEERLPKRVRLKKVP